MVQLVAELTARLAVRELGLQTITDQAPGPQMTMQSHLFGQFLFDAMPAEQEIKLAPKYHAGWSPVSVVASLIIAWVCMRGQEHSPAFEVASVKPASPSAPL